MQFHILGPLSVLGTEGPITIGSRRRRALLATLLLHPGRFVSLSALVDGIWADDPPHSAIANIRTYVSDLRRQLKQANDSPLRLVSSLTGYRLDVTADELDLLRFRDLVADGRRALGWGDQPGAADRFGLALGLWRGRALEDLPDLGSAISARMNALEEERWAVTTKWIDARLALGHHGELVPLLRQLVSERPLDEQTRAQLIIALHAAGRTADALAAFRDARQVAFEELGVEPSADLQRIHVAILSGEPLPPGRPGTGPPTGSPQTTLAPHAAAPHVTSPRTGPETSESGTVEPSMAGEPPEYTAPPGRFVRGSRPRPSSLPPRPRQLAGRQGARSQLATIGQAISRQDPTGANCGVVAISGAPGVGKSALALWGAYDLRNFYPDGQLYLSLQGSAELPCQPPDALSEILCALGVDDTQIPLGLSERTVLYRSILAERRLLLLFDDVTSVEQIKPLLPGVGRSLAIITSGARLVELDAWWHCNLDALGEAEAVELLAYLAGPDRVRSAPDAAARIAAACGGLPLALRIAGIRLNTLPGVALTTFAARLEDDHNRLDELAIGEISVRSSLSRTYRSLDATARRLFRSLGRANIPRFTGAVAGDLLNMPRVPADRVLERLHRHNLLIAVADTGKDQHYEMPPLIRIYARECAGALPLTTSEQAA